MLKTSDKWKETIDRDDRHCVAYFTLHDTTIDDNIFEFSIIDSIYDEDFIGSFVKKKLTASVLNKNIYNFDNQKIKVYAGLHYDDTNEDEYVFLGTYIVSKATFDNVSLESSLECYDLSTLFDVRYNNVISYPCTRKQYIEDCCSQAGVVFSNESFPMDDLILTEAPYLDEGSTIRDAVRQIAKSCMCNSKIIEDKLYLKPMLKTTVDIVLEDYFDLSTEEKIGPYNVLVLGRSPQNDNVYYPEVLPENPYEYKIENNYVVDDNRELYIKKMYEYINGLTFIPFNITMLKGRPDITSMDYLTFVDMKDINRTSIIFTHEFKFDGSFSSVISCSSQSKTTSDYKRAGTISNRLSVTEIKTDKNEKQLLLLTSQVEDVEDSVGNTYTKEQVNQLIQNAETGLINTFTSSGGNNLLRNTAPWFMTSENTGEYWTGNLKQMVESDATSEYAILTQNGTISQSVSLPSGTYSVSFRYKKLINASEGYVRYNGKTFNLTETSGEIHSSGEITNNQFVIEINSNTNDSFEIYDLILKHGSEGIENMLVWTQNANESRSDTVQISEGITTTSSIADTTATMDSAGFIVRNKTTGTAVMEATKTGGKFLDLTSTGKSNLSGLLVQKVGSKICINGESGS